MSNGNSFAVIRSCVETCKSGNAEFAQFLIAADFFEIVEDGNDAQFGRALRWMGENQKFPLYFKPDKEYPYGYWVWLTTVSAKTYDKASEHAILPDALTRSMRCAGDKPIAVSSVITLWQSAIETRYQSWVAAILDLANTFHHGV